MLTLTVASTAKDSIGIENLPIHDFSECVFIDILSKTKLLRPNTVPTAGEFMIGIVFGVISILLKVSDPNTVEEIEGIDATVGHYGK